jgi:hypothetical protein
VSTAAVFVGPTIAPADVAARLPDVRVEPPVERGDLDRLSAEGVSTFLIIDGVFAHSLAVAPSEIVRVCRAGARVIGAASLGAIRAAECAPAGVDGVGAVCLLYRWRVIRDDDEVAVAVDPSHAHRAVSDALINIRFAVVDALRHGLLDREGGRAVLAAAKGMHFSRRHWRAALAEAGVRECAALQAVWRESDVKRRDAELALDQLARSSAAAIERARAGVRVPAAPRERRYRGHDPLLGLDETGAREVLRAWLSASGRWQRYVEAAPQPGEEDLVWERLSAARELESELLRWYAATRSAGALSAAR